MDCRQNFIWADVCLSLIGSLDTNCNEIHIKNIGIFIQKNEVEIVVSTIAAIASRPRCGRQPT